MHRRKSGYPRYVSSLVGQLCLMSAGGASGQSMMPVVDAVPGLGHSGFVPHVCFEWDLATPFPIGCPPSVETGAPISGCVGVTIVGEPASAVTLNDFEIVYETLPEQTAVFFTQGTIDFVFEPTTVRLAAGEGPIVATYFAPDDVFRLGSFDIEINGRVVITETMGDAGAFPLDEFELADVVFPPATGHIEVRTSADTGERVVKLHIDIGDPFAIPGGRLDAGSGFIVGIGGEVFAYATGNSCDMPSCSADTNHDGQLTPTDFTAWINAFNNGLPECDQNGDGGCTATDFTAWIANYNAGCG